jgi:hypothetical protein
VRYGALRPYGASIQGVLPRGSSLAATDRLIVSSVSAVRLHPRINERRVVEQSIYFVVDLDTRSPCCMAELVRTPGIARSVLFRTPPRKLRNSSPKTHAEDDLSSTPRGQGHREKQQGPLCAERLGTNSEQSEGGKKRNKLPGHLPFADFATVLLSFFPPFSFLLSSLGEFCHCVFLFLPLFPFLLSPFFSFPSRCFFSPHLERGRPSTAKQGRCQLEKLSVESTADGRFARSGRSGGCGGRIPINMFRSVTVVNVARL